MNRQQRRALERQRKIEKKVEEDIRRAKCSPKEIEVELYFTVFGLALEEIYGFKTERIKKVWKRADEYITEICDKKVTFEQLKERLRNKASIECSFH